MAKVADFSFCNNLPTFTPTRHCLKIVSNSTLYLSLTFLTILQLIAVILLCLNEKSREMLLPNDWSLELERGWLPVAATASIWIFVILFSLLGYAEKIHYSHFPLAFIEISFCVFSFACTSYFGWTISTPDNKPSSHIPSKQEQAEIDTNRWFYLYKSVFCLILTVFHVYYTYVIYYLWKDVREKRRNEQFIARQKMFDDVCEEMVWEEEAAEEEAHRYAELNHSRAHSRVYTMDEVYEADECSLYSQSGHSVSSAELRIGESRMMAIYNESIYHNRRHVSFYDENGNAYL